MSKIVAIETVIPDGIMPNLVLLRIHTDDGLIGCGETYYTPHAIAALIHDWMAERLLGGDCAGGREPLATRSRSSSKATPSSSCRRPFACGSLGFRSGKSFVSGGSTSQDAMVLLRQLGAMLIRPNRLVVIKRVRWCAGSPCSARHRYGAFRSVAGRWSAPRSPLTLQ